MPNYLPTIGLEIHAELKTQSKMFCDCPNDPDEKHPNINVCPICLGHPGTLPTINKRAVEAVIKVGLALGGTVFSSGRTKFDRKNYFYPDLPKGYQISQYDEPLVRGGSLNGVAITRVHLEEDTGRLLHHDHNNDYDNDKSEKRHSYRHESSYTLVDFNRAGVPLMELVTEPVIGNAEEARRFAKEFQLVLRYLGVSDADMEKGQLRVEANISVAEEGSSALGTKVEVKNLNSFRAVEGAIGFEVARQGKLLAQGKDVLQETRGWNEDIGETFSQRLKEEAHDYRYFPEPDLPPLTPEAFDIKALKLEIPELPDAKRVRFAGEYELSVADVESLAQDPAMADFFERAASELKEDYPDAPLELLFNYLTSDLRGLMNETGTAFADLRLSAENFADLIGLVAAGKVSSRSAKDVLRKMLETDVDPGQLLSGEELTQVSDSGALAAVVEEVLLSETAAVADYKKGKGNALQFLIGKAMAKLKGRGNPEILKALFIKRLM